MNINKFSPINQKEIERKILGIDVRKLVAQIKKLRPAPKKLFEGKLRIKYYDFTDGRIHKKRDLLRIREFWPKSGKPYSELVYKLYKGVQKNCKVFDELEFVIPGTHDAEKLGLLFGRMGLKEMVYYEKKRTLYKWGDVKFEIDEHPKIPAFMEIEGKSPAAIEKAIKALGLEENEQSAETIEELLKRKYSGVSLNDLRF